jgi:predicted PurR-regulated permease PerM
VAVLLGFGLAAWIASPLWVGLFLGAVCAFTMQPMYRRLAARWNNRRHLAAAVVTVGSGAVGAALLGGAGVVLGGEVGKIIVAAQALLKGPPIAQRMGPRLVRVLQSLGYSADDVGQRLHESLASAAEHVAAAASLVAKTATEGLLGLMLALMTMYYVLLEWSTVTVKMERVLPLDPRHTRALVLEFREVGRTTLLGTVVTALAQGAFALIGYLIAGIPEAVTWAVLTCLASFVPVLGTIVVWAPIAIWLLVTGHVAAGIFLSVWGSFVVVWTADWLIRPRIVGHRGATQPLLMLVSILGGIEVLGLAGLLVGPIVMSLFIAMLRIYEREAVKVRAE